MKKFKFKINESLYEVSINEIDKNVAEIEVNGTPFTVEIEKHEKSGTTASKKPAGKVTPITTPTRIIAAESIKSPLPGIIIKVLVQPGQSVKRGSVLLTMESMKMENNILAEEDTIVKTVRVQPGQSVLQDDILVDFVGSEVAVTPTTAPAPAPKPTPAPVVETPPAAAKPVQKSNSASTIKSPLPGSVFKVLVSVGQTVNSGDSLLILESMKMENNILAEKSGTVKTIYVQPGQTVMQDDELIDLE
jgi:biotin carboxyl carrier protein